MVPRCGTSILLMMQMMMRLRRDRRRLRNHRRRRRGKESHIPISLIQSSKGTKVVIILCDWFSKSRSSDEVLVGFNSVVNMQENPVQSNPDKPQTKVRFKQMKRNSVKTRKKQHSDARINKIQIQTEKGRRLT